MVGGLEENLAISEVYQLFDVRKTASSPQASVSSSVKRYLPSRTAAEVTQMYACARVKCSQQCLEYNRYLRSAC